MSPYPAIEVELQTYEEKNKSYYNIGQRNIRNED